jgi:hypothetical protein
MRLFLLGLFAATLLAPSPLRAEQAKTKTQDIDLVVCLDVSGSMNGLIDSAKARLWDIVNEMAKLKPTPNLRVALYSYGHSSYTKESGYVRKETDLTVDLDEVYAKLNALKISGGTELVARVTKASLLEQKWSTEKNSLKLIFVCGNEPANQDTENTLDTVATLSKELGVIVNTIYCGPSTHADTTQWASFAAKAGGKYATINQDGTKKIPHIESPYDKDILSLNEKLNTTYVAMNTVAGKKAAENQVAQDKNAGAAAPAAGLARATSKAEALYRNSSWCLVDKMKEDPKFDLSKIKEEELPEELKKLKAEERLPYLKKKAVERAEIQAKISDLSAKRQKHIDEELKKLPKTEGEKVLDEALKSIIREQATAKGFTAEKK